MKFLKQLIREMIYDERVAIKAVPYAEIEKKFNAFHLTTANLGEKFTPRLKPPLNPYEDAFGDVIEDAVTDRMSIAKTIKGCLKGIQGISFTNPETQYYVYAANIKTFKPIGRWCPSSPNNKYGPDFTWKKYEDWWDKNKKDDDEDLYKSDAIRNCVPDAKETGEKWVVEDLEVKDFSFIGWTLSSSRYMGEIDSILMKKETYDMIFKKGKGND